LATPQLALSAEPSGDTLRAGQLQAMAREAFGAAQENRALSLAQRALDLNPGPPPWLAQQIRLEILERWGSLDDVSKHLPEYLPVACVEVGVCEAPQQVFEGLTRRLGSDCPTGSGDDRPMRSVSWIEALAFCNALSAADDLTLADSFEGTHPMWLLDTDGWRLPTDNAWGLSDFSGNFDEGVQVRYGSYPEAATVDPCGPAEGFEHVLRGGSGTVGLHIVRMITP
jgi:hypothetical protein